MERLKNICDSLENCVMTELGKDKSEIDAQELGEVIDAIKDVKMAMYYGSIIEAMKDSEYGEEYDENGPRSYRGRSARTGRYVHRAYEAPDMKMIMRDMDKDENKMYYSEDALIPSRHYGNMSYEEGHRKGYEEGHRNGYREGHNRGYEEGRNSAGSSMSSSRYDSARRGFEEGHDKEQKSKALTEYMRTIADDITNMVMEMDPQEKQVVKNKLQAIQNKIA